MSIVDNETKRKRHGFQIKFYSLRQEQKELKTRNKIQTRLLQNHLTDYENKNNDDNDD
jgi:hypothetical protein